MHTPVINLPEVDRATFVGNVYKHVAGALAAFMAFEVLLFNLGIADSMRSFFFEGGSQARWLLVLGGFMAMQWFAANAAADLVNPSRQYVGLFVAALGQALIFAPMLSYAFDRDPGAVLQAAVVTGIAFALLTAIGLFTRKDLSFLRPIMMWGFGLALIAIVGAVIFNFALGTWFALAMIGLSGVSILYQTQSVVRRYPVQAHVAAAVALFSSLMQMFWYVLQLFLSRD
jgi:FtsH-binding integral membrane protein